MNTRRKLLLFGKPPAETAQDLLDALVNRVESDSGAVTEQAFIKSFYEMVLDANALQFMRDHSIVLFPEVRRIESGTAANKMYSLFDAGYDATQTSGAIQPAVIDSDRNGRSAINYVDGNRLNLPDAKALDFTKNTDYIELSGVHDSVFDEDTPYFIHFTTTDSILATRANLGMSGGDDRVGARRLDTDSFSQASAARISNYRYVSGRNRYDLGEITLFQNSTEVATNTDLTVGMTPDTPSGSADIGCRNDGLAATQLNGKGLAIFGFNAQVPPALRSAIDTFIMNAYDLPAV